MVRILHDSVRGRTRFRVPGLLLSESLKQHLETEMTRFPEVLSVRASSATGSLLVAYNADHDSAWIQDRIAVALNGRRAAPALPDTMSRVRAPAAGPPGAGDRQSVTTTRAAKSLKEVVPSAPVDDDTPPWHLLRRRKILDKLSVQADRGLTKKEARRRRKVFGDNRLPEARGRSEAEILLGQINSLPTFLLAAAAGVSALTGGLLEAGVVLGVVAANAMIGFVTEREAEKTIHSLRSLVSHSATVLRKGKVRRIAVDELVLGDVVLLKPGTYVGADCRILESSDLTIDESMLTGESMPVRKGAGRMGNGEVPLADRTNMAFMGTRVTGGHGVAVVVASGVRTQIGQLQTLLQDTERPETPMERQLRIIGDQLVLLCGGICGVVFGVGFLRGYGAMQMLNVAVSLAAAAVPEGLPAAATINFALGIKQLRRDNVLVRRLQAVETLGAVHTVCMDKTGTITWNRMSVRRMFTGGRRYDLVCGQIQCDGCSLAPGTDDELFQLIRVCVLCSEVKVKGGAGGDFQLRGSATENALVRLALSAGIDAKALRRDHPLVDVNHRSEKRLYMSTRHRFNGGDNLMALKGSPQEVLALCGKQMVDGAVVPLTDADRMAIEMENARMAGDALRVLGLAFAVTGPDQDLCMEDCLVWLGLVGMADPVRDGVAELVAGFHRAGMDTVMITGDQSSTAYAVARELNLSGDRLLEILDSADLSTLDGPALVALARKAHVYSRVTPADKLKIVRALQAGGSTVAMTGDGINDGPALKAADLGIAMGKSGTDVAREVADIVLEDDNLDTLLKAVADGRGIYSNIRKSVRFFLATNLSEIMVTFAAMAGGIGFPLNVMQLLWINIISDIFPGLALSLESPEPDVLQRPPRDGQAPLFSASDFRRMFFESATISGGALGAYGLGLMRYGAGARATTLAFQSLTVGQLLHAFCCRSEVRRGLVFDEAPRNRYLDCAIGGSLAVQLLTVFFPPVRRLLGVTRLGLADMAVVGGFATLPLLINEATKKGSHRSQGTTSAAFPGT